MANLSIITAALCPDEVLLRRAAISLAEATVHPTPWVFVIDDARSGEQHCVEALLADALRGSSILPSVYALPFRATAGGARSIGLAHVDPRWFGILDADDLLTPASLDIQLEMLRGNPSARWCLGAGETLHQDGSRKLWTHGLPAAVPRGYVARVTKNTGVMPTIPIAAVWEADLIRSLGAWQALPRDEDTSLKLAATTAAPGVSIALSTYVYRRDLPNQLTHAESYGAAGQWCRKAALDRVKALCTSDDLADIPDGDWSSFLLS